MERGSSLTPELPWVLRLLDLEAPRDHAVAGTKLKELRRVAERLGEELRAGPTVVSVRTLPLTTLVYPTKHAFAGACLAPAPLVVLTHRSLLVQVERDGELRNILFNPTDVERARATPYFARLAQRLGPTLVSLVARSETSVLGHLERLGLSGEDIDLIAFDHFHTQDLRRLLGEDGWFPKAKLLAPRAEWEAWDDLHPWQQPWYVGEGKQDIDRSQVVVFDADLELGPGCLLLRTPGHTEGNQTLFAHTSEGVFGCSENGTSADSYSPYESAIPGLRGLCRSHRYEVVPNTNTPDITEQYTSMLLERSIVDRVPDRPEFFQMFPSSEVTPSALAPGVRPSMVFGERVHGAVRNAARG